MNKKIIIYTTCLVIVDQLVKILIENNLVSPVNIIPGFLTLYPVKNYGISFSLFSGNRFLIIIASVVACYFLIKYMIEFRENKPYTYLIATMLAGALGNLIDRIVRGYVVDYISITAFNHNFAIFNLADTMLVCATFILVVKIIIDEKGKNEKNIS